LNLERLKGCCIHVARPDGRLIPFCSFNLTARSGTPLHRPQRRRAKTTSVDALIAARFALPSGFTREDVEQAQLGALCKTLEHAVNESPFYRRHLAGFTKLQSLCDLQHLPLLTSDDIVSQGQRLLCVSQSTISRVVTLQTSGSIGAAKRLFFTEADLAATSTFFLQGMQTLVDSSDRVLIMLPFQQPDSVGDLLLRALQEGGIEARGIWPPEKAASMAAVIHRHRLSCAVGLPQHLLALAYAVGPGLLKSMLLCSDYAAPALRRRIEDIARCETFLHYGATESGLGGAVECEGHCGCHIRESDLLIEIIDPDTCRPMPCGESGEVVITTLRRQAMPLIRYRTGDTAFIDRSRCVCGGRTARLNGIRGRLDKSRFADGQWIASQDLDDFLYQIPGLLDYRLILDHDGSDRLHVDFLAAAGYEALAGKIKQQLLSVTAIRNTVSSGALTLGKIGQVAEFAPTHTVKRTIQDLRK
jgi:phenylacetate-coenzyme A ligase PaaK-like adenylate-forming protein